MFVGASIFFFELTARPSSSAPGGPVESDWSMNESTNTLWRHNIVEGLVNLDFSNYHLSPRGINLQDEGLIFQPYVRLDWILYKPVVPVTLDKVTFTTAVFNDFDTVASGVEQGNWNEIDFIAGPNATFCGHWTVESPFIVFKSETASYPACWAWNPRLTYHDHLTEHFSINPYAEFFAELKNKITVVLVPETSERSYYGAIGMVPTYTFDRLPLKLELPTYVLIPGANFYQQKNGSGGGTDLALFATTLRATVPLNFISASWGKWSLYAGIQYDHLNNPGLLDGNEATGVGTGRVRNIMVLHGGVTVRF